ncbi:MAG: hypothetical protein WAS36_02110 [Candidatus Saccharimonadales bacterium]
MNTSINLESVKMQLNSLAQFVNRYKAIAFFLVITTLYGFIIWRINVLSTAPASQEAIAEVEKAATQPRINEATIKKMESLQDNSVRVQTLFNDARNNPFEE